MLHDVDPDEHLIKVPPVTGPRTTAAQAVGKALGEFLAPAPSGLVGDDNAPLSQQELHISKAEAEHVVQPNTMADDLGDTGGMKPPPRPCYRVNAIPST